MQTPLQTPAMSALPESSIRSRGELSAAHAAAAAHSSSATSLAEPRLRKTQVLLPEPTDTQVRTSQAVGHHYALMIDSHWQDAAGSTWTVQSLRALPYFGSSYWHSMQREHNQQPCPEQKQNIQKHHVPCSTFKTCFLNFPKCMMA